MVNVALLIATATPLSAENILAARMIGNAAGPPDLNFPAIDKTVFAETTPFLVFASIDKHYVNPYPGSNPPRYDDFMFIARGSASGGTNHISVINHDSQNYRYCKLIYKIDRP